MADTGLVEAVREEVFQSHLSHVIGYRALESVMRKVPFVAIAFFGVTLLGNTSAISGGVEVGSTVVPDASQPLRAQPPGGFFAGKGKEIGLTKPGDKYIVLDEKFVPSITGTESWVKLKSVGSEDVGWSLNGRSSETLTNFKTVE
jgi:hypothetical protein